MTFFSKAFIIKTGGLFCFVFALVIGCLGQVKQDTSSIRKSVKENLNKLAKTIYQKEDEVLVEKSEDPYLDFEGKIIRKIIIKHISFDKNILDTARTFKNYISKAANKLHSSTKEYVIRNNLFVKEGKPLNPYRVADNERWLRNLNYILDARIYVEPISTRSDSVDLLIVTRDVFSVS